MYVPASTRRQVATIMGQGKPAPTRCPESHTLSKLVLLIAWAVINRRSLTWAHEDLARIYHTDVIAIC